MKHNVLAELHDRLVPIDEVRTHRSNPRRGDVPTIADSLTVTGQYRPIVRRAETNEALVGNGTLAAARMLGWSHVAVRDHSCDDRTAARIVLADNRSSDLARYDDNALAALLAAAARDDGLLGTGFSDSDYRDLLASLGDGALDLSPGLGGLDPSAGVLREVMLIYPTEELRSEAMRLLNRLAASWSEPDLGAVAVRALAAL